MAFLTFARRPDFVARPQFWAEDVIILFSQARAGGWHTLFTPYPDYYIFAQRLVACVAAPLPAVWAPAIYCYSAWAYLLLSSWFCLRARLDDLMDRRGRIALALALILVPQSGEIVVVLIGSPWTLAPILCLLILQAAPRKPGSAAMDLLGLALAGLSGPFIVLFAPWFLLRFRRVGGGFSPYNCLLVAVAWSLAAVQFCSIRQSPPYKTAWCRDPHQWIKELGMQLPGGLFFGAHLPGYIGAGFYVIAPALLALLGWALWRMEGKRRWAALVLGGCAASVYVGAINKTQPEMVAWLDPFRGAGRYFYPVYLFAMWLGIVCFYDAASARLRAAAAAALVMMLLASASLFTFTPQPDLHWKHYARQLDAGAAQENVPILPTDWKMDFPARK